MSQGAALENDGVSLVDEQDIARAVEKSPHTQDAVATGGKIPTHSDRDGHAQSGQKPLGESMRRRGREDKEGRPEPN